MRLSFPYHWRWLTDRLSDRYLDQKFGIVSSERRSLAQLGVDLPDCIDYQPVSYSDLRKLLDSLPIRDKDVFLDFGSGMGRALCIAAMYPFRSVIGVEMSPELCAIARRNIDRIRTKLRCQDLKVVNMNAIDYQLPPDVSMIFFFNPFGGRILGKVLNNIAISLRNAPRQLSILFCGTASTDNFRSQAKTQDWLTLHSEILLPTGAVGLIYANDYSSVSDIAAMHVRR